jgi:lycopene beta-cyclase
MADSGTAAFDIIIVGGGLSGLALAARLTQPGFSNLRILVLEQRENYTRDRTWSYWRTPHHSIHRYSHLERQQWRRWRVRCDADTDAQASGVVTKNSENENYCSLDSDRFYSDARRTIAQSGNVQLRLNTAVQQITGADKPWVKTLDGIAIQAQWIFDARPSHQIMENNLVQQFLGFEIEVDDDVFDPTTVDLMHFRPSVDGLHFFYVLPYSTRNALVETTWISPASFKPDFGTEVKEFIASIVGAATYEIRYQETGVLDLESSHGTCDAKSHVMPLGRRAGTLRASTGYAFLETLQHAEVITTSLAKHLITGRLQDWRPPPFRRPVLDRWMDKIFLEVLKRDWATSPSYFMRLFERLDADAMVAFLSGRASWQQRLSVMTALPTLPFAKQALSTLIGERLKLSSSRPTW